MMKDSTQPITPPKEGFAYSMARSPGASASPFGEHTSKQQLSTGVPTEQPNKLPFPYSTARQERTLKALTLLLGPETAYATRLRATRYLARQGSAVLPLLLSTLHHYPELTWPSWPGWPPQYERCSRLLIHLCQDAHLSLEALLQHPAISQPTGPVLWTSVIEAVDAQPDAAHESLLRNGLAAPWETTRYAAAMALANLASIVLLHESTRAALRMCQSTQEPVSIRLAASYTLLRNGDSSGIEVLMKLLADNMTGEVCKAIIFVLATEPPTHLNPQQHEQLTQLLLTALVDENTEISQLAARTLGSIAHPSTALLLFPLLAASLPSVQMAALLTLEEMAQHKAIRLTLRHHMLSANILPLLRSTSSPVRRQASYTLAAIGGEYVTAVLGTALRNSEHIGQIEAIEALRLLHGVLRHPTRAKVVQWLLYILAQPQEEVQVTALDSLAYLVWQTRSRRKLLASTAICSAISQDGTPLRLLASPHAWVRQRAVELLCMLDNQPPALHAQLLHLLHNDSDSGVRACIAFVLGQVAARWAIPALLQALLDSDEHVAITALNALDQLATTADAIVLYCIQELAIFGSTAEHSEDALLTSARLLLKKWHTKYPHLL
ncbi:MAG: HEAT repeat domain-containing protein [Ktedonobacteraceae bacterium]